MAGTPFLEILPGLFERIFELIILSVKNLLLRIMEHFVILTRLWLLVFVANLG